MGNFVFVKSFLATLVQNINFLVKSAEKVKWRGGEQKEYTFPVRAIRHSQIPNWTSYLQQDAPEEVISAVNVVVAEEAFTVKCFLTMMASGSKIKSHCI